MGGACGDNVSVLRGTTGSNSSFSEVCSNADFLREDYLINYELYMSEIRVIPLESSAIAV